MQETYEIRLFTQYLPLIAREITAPEELPSVATILRGVVGDPQFRRVGELDERLRRSKQGMAFGGWEIRRTYSNSELAQAQLFLLNVRFKHLSAEEYGTSYEEFQQCQHEIDSLEYLNGEFRIVRQRGPCSIRAKQIGALRFPYRKLGSTRDIFRLWGGELVVSDRFKDLIDKNEFTGATFIPTCDATRPNRSNSRAKGEFAQLCIQSKPLLVSERTRFGATPFDTQRSGFDHCEGGTIAGDRPISQISVAASSWDGSDLCTTDVYVGGRGGLFRPHQLLVVSKRVLEAFQGRGIKGFQHEVVELNY